MSFHVAPGPEQLVDEALHDLDLLGRVLPVAGLLDEHEAAGVGLGTAMTRSAIPGESNHPRP
jgi:hypothetical protein